MDNTGTGNVNIWTHSNQGWTCPKCGRCWAPFVSMCTFCPPNIGWDWTVTTTTAPLNGQSARRRQIMYYSPCKLCSGENGAIVPCRGHEL